MSSNKRIGLNKKGTAKAK